MEFQVQVFQEEVVGNPTRCIFRMEYHFPELTVYIWFSAGVIDIPAEVTIIDWIILPTTYLELVVSMP